VGLSDSLSRAGIEIRNHLEQPRESDDNYDRVLRKLLSMIDALRIINSVHVYADEDRSEENALLEALLAVDTSKVEAAMERRVAVCRQEIRDAIRDASTAILSAQHKLADQLRDVPIEQGLRRVIRDAVNAGERLAGFADAPKSDSAPGEGARIRSVDQAKIDTVMGLRI